MSAGLKLLSDMSVTASSIFLQHTGKINVEQFRLCFRVAIEHTVVLHNTNRSHVILLDKNRYLDERANGRLNGGRSEARNMCDF